MQTQESTQAPASRALISTQSADSTVTAPAKQNRAGHAKLLPVLGIWFGIAAAIGNTIAAGIVRTPGEIAQVLPSSFWFMAVWVLGGIYGLCGATCLAELGAMIPRSGGQYNYSRIALGDYAGFIVGWSDWLSNCGTLAAVSLVIAEYSCKLFAINDGAIKTIAIATVVGIALLQSKGIKSGSSFQLFTAVLKTAAFLVLVLACFFFGHSAATSAAAPAAATGLVMPAGMALFAAVMLGLQAVIYTIDGWNSVIYFGEEVQEPGRDVPRAIFGSVFSIMAIYLLLNAAVLYILPINEIAGNKFCLGSVAEKIFGVYGDTVIRTIMVVSLISCINAVQMCASRILYAISSDGLFFSKVAQVSKGGTPVIALTLSTIVGVIFVLGSFERVIAMNSFFFVANYMLSCISLFVLRKKNADLPRPYKAWGYPLIPGIALIGSALFLAGSICADRENAPLALLLLICSYPVFKLLRKRITAES